MPGLTNTEIAKPNKKSVWRRIKLEGVSYAMMTPYMILFFIMTVIPVIAAMGLSFTYFNMLELPSFTGFLNYSRMFLDDSVFLIVLKNTLIFAFITGPLSYMISFLSAWLINEMSRGIRSCLTLFFYGPSLVANMFFIWQYIFSGDSYGWINGIATQLGIIKEPILWLSDTKYMMTSLIVVQLWSSLGAGFLAFIAGFQNMDKSYFEAGALDGIKNRWQELWYITIPQMSSQLLFAAVMQIGASFGVSGIISTLAGKPTTDYAADTILTYADDLGTVRFEMGYACAICVFLFVIMLFTNFIIENFLRKFSED